LLQHRCFEKRFTVEPVQSLGLTEDPLPFRRDERTQSAVAARVTGCGHEACGRWSWRLGTKLIFTNAMCEISSLNRIEGHKGARLF
jgi:hypothetical protein